MASLHLEEFGYRLYVQLNGKREKIWLGKISKTKASDWKSRVEDLVEAIKTGDRPKQSTTAWLDELPLKMRKKLEDLELLPRRRSACLQVFLDNYLSGHPSEKKNTIRNLKNTCGTLIDFFGAARDLREISPGDAEDWANRLKAKSASATVSKHIKRAKQFFTYAEKHSFIESNPFRELKANGEVNEDRKEFVPVEDAVAVLDAIADREFRLVVALARFGGLRTPSETLALKWSDVDFEKLEMRVCAPKKEGTGRAIRRVPIFPELLPFLLAYRSDAKSGGEHVVNKLRRLSGNWRGKLHRAIRRAGVRPWQKVFVNLRASRETELIQQGNPVADVTSWLGNSPQIAAKHYVMSTDQAFKKAIQASPVVDLGRFLGQQPQAAAGSPASFERVSGKETPSFPTLAFECHSSPEWLVPPRGVEDSSDSRVNAQILAGLGADLGALDRNLRFLIALWTQLDDDQRAQLLNFAQQAVARASVI